jgi:cyanate permease
MAAMGGFATMTAQILAHQGGWDEALFVLAPLVIIGLLLLLANRRANAARRVDDPASRPVDADDA